MTTFYDWLYLGQTQYDPDDLNKREKELAQLAWEEAQPSVPEGWKLVPEDPTEEMIVAFVEQWYCHKQTIDDPKMGDAYQDMLEAAPKFGEEQ